MLKNMVLKNFLSFKDETIINFEKSNYQFLDERNTFNKITKGAFFIGANASGKTNGIKGIRVLLDLLFGHTEVDFNKFVCGFSDSSKIELSYEFTINNKTIKYDIERDTINKAFRETLVFNGDIILNRMKNNAEYKLGENSEFDSFEDIDSDTLFLREIYFNTKFRAYPDLTIWFSYLRNSIYINARNKSIDTYSNIKLMLDEYLELHGTVNLNNSLNELIDEFQIEYSENCMGNRVKYLNQNNEKSVFIRRKRINEPFPLDLESEGTANLLNLLPSFLHVVENNGMLIIDEFSSAFHNFLERVLVEFFYKNSKESQLFLVTHATNLLSSEILRPDQVFTFNFIDDSGTHVIKVSEYAKPRTSQNFEKMYLSGMFEGIPSYE